MRIFFINAVCGTGSTGRIVADLAEFLRNQGHTVGAAYGVGQGPEWAVKINDKMGYYLHNGLSRLTDHAGLYSRRQTRFLIEKLREFGPDVVHIHTLHGYYVNYQLLCRYLSEEKVPVVMTLHDCWAFTGHCTHFSRVGCQGWKTGCRKCPQLREYPVCWGFGDSAGNFRRKKEAFCSLENLTIVTPSRWLESLARQSFLKNANFQVVPNGIDNGPYRPLMVPKGIFSGPMVLGVAAFWSPGKGLSDFCRLAKLLPEYQIVLIGLTPTQRKKLPPEILGLGPIHDPEELAKWYSAAEVFVNPTYEDTFPTVNLEAQACGTPVVTYDACGSPETLVPGTGRVVPVGDVEALARAIREGVAAPRGDEAQLDRAAACRSYYQLYTQLAGR